MNKATTNSYFPFFGVPYHLILHGKISGLEITAWNRFFFLGGGGGDEWGSGGGVIFGPRIVLVSSGNRQVCADKTAW